ncbi:MAG: TrkA family potassium uptake protein [Candidatus Omnitrophica bacterium]|nr:TrkA family potassium uptake protein [Candidatus Omnitrophota bacterium]MBU4478235.1 TrkA family potassium uptake protein [Candidatus Omnitrophota bacterium]
MYVIIVGCGRVGSKLAQILSQEAHDVVIIDKEQNSFRRLGDTFNGLTLCGNGVNLEFLKTAGIEKADVFCVLTDGDNTNLMAAQIAKKIFNVPKVFARVYDPQRASIFSSFGFEIISGTMLIASMLRDKITDAKFSSYLVETRELEVMRIDARDEFIGKTAGALNVPDEFSVITVIRAGSTLLPQPDTVIEKNDVLFGLVKTDRLENIRKKFKI